MFIQLFIVRVYYNIRILCLHQRRPVEYLIASVVLLQVRTVCGFTVCWTVHTRQLFKTKRMVYDNIL